MPGSTRSRPILAVLSTPHTTLFMTTFPAGRRRPDDAPTLCQPSADTTRRPRNRPLQAATRQGPALIGMNFA